MKLFYVYILRCSDNAYYIGQTDDLEKRMAEYQEKINCGTFVSKRFPVVLVFYEEFATRIEAIEAERKLKKWSRKKKETLIHSGWHGLKGIYKK